MMSTAKDRKKILIVDDDADISNPLSSSLLSGGFDVSSAADGEKGLAAVREWKPDLVVLDVRMPKKDGWEVLREIREDPDTEDLPVIMLTALKDEQSKVLGFRGGADDYLDKPFSILELIARVERIFEREERVGTKKPLGKTGLEKIPVKKEDDFFFVPLEDVFFIEAAGKYSYIHTRDQRLLCDLSLKEIEDSLSDSNNFYRIHRSYIVNLNRVNRVVKETPDRYIVELTDDAGTTIYVSRRRLRGLRDTLHF